MPTRRVILSWLAAAPLLTNARPAHADALEDVLGAVGPLEAGAFHPGRALAAIQALSAAGPAAGLAALRRVAAQPDPPEGLFAVLRALVALPAAGSPAAPWPGVLQSGWLRPPALGAPYPEAPAPLLDLPRFPLLLLGDVPLVLVSGYALGGQPEPLSMHLDGLVGAPWRTRPWRPEPPAAVQARLEASSWWAGFPLQAELLAQLRRYARQEE